MKPLESLGGSSPLTRGARSTSSRRGVVGGIIPAHAGSTAATPTLQSRGSDHPRSRGEHFTGLANLKPGDGSSPLTRGAPLVVVLALAAVRIIPAHAGSTVGDPRPSGGRKDHPRSRGEHGSKKAQSPRQTGSSPLTRGAPRRRLHRHPRHRIIPAHAGSTPPSSGGCLTRLDHPRSRGEHNNLTDLCLAYGGSSPLTRGAHDGWFPSYGSSGIIPAHAGSTWGCLVRKPLTTDHPRSRGEHRSTLKEEQCLLGSSPLTRGARRMSAGSVRVAGIIPAHAGSTQQVVGNKPQTWDHPRSRGEHVVRTLFQAVVGGSSPLTRGARCLLVRQR